MAAAAGRVEKNIVMGEKITTASGDLEIAPANNIKFNVETLLLSFSFPTLTLMMILKYKHLIEIPTLLAA